MFGLVFSIMSAFFGGEEFGPGSGDILLEDGGSFLMMEDGSSFLLLEA